MKSNARSGHAPNPGKRKTAHRYKVSVHAIFYVDDVAPDAKTAAKKLKQKYTTLKAMLTALCTARANATFITMRHEQDAMNNALITFTEREEQ